MAELRYIMQGFQENINFLDEIKYILENNNYADVWVLTAFVNDLAVYNLMPSIKKSKARISFIVGIRNNVTTYQALGRLCDLNVNLFTFDTARAESIFHAKVIVGYGTESARIICGSANITTGGLANNIEAGIITNLDLKVKADESFLVEARNYIEKMICDYPENVKVITNKK
jgi:HKD family nuclease